MRPTRSAAAVLALAAALPVHASTPAGFGAWPPLPPATKAMILATGGEAGNYRPRNCDGRDGGALYRLNFNQWLARQVPDVARFWVSTGDSVPFQAQPPLIDYGEMYAFMGRVGYTLAGVGEIELANPGAAVLVEKVPGLPFPLLAVNLRVHETGAPALPGSRIVEIAGTRWLFTAIAPYQPDKVWGSAGTGTIVTVPAGPALREELERLRGHYDRVILLSSELNAELPRVLKEAPGVDLVLASAGVYMNSEPETVAGVPVLYIGMFGRMLGRVALGERGQILEVRGAFVRDEFPVDPQTGEITVRQ